MKTEQKQRKATKGKHGLRADHTGSMDWHVGVLGLGNMAHLSPVFKARRKECRRGFLGRELRESPEKWLSGTGETLGPNTEQGPGQITKRHAQFKANTQLEVLVLWEGSSQRHLSESPSLFFLPCSTCDPWVFIMNRPHLEPVPSPPPLVGLGQSLSLPPA